MTTKYIRTATSVEYALQQGEDMYVTIFTVDPVTRAQAIYGMPLGKWDDINDVDVLEQIKEKLIKEKI